MHCVTARPDATVVLPACKLGVWVDQTHGLEIGQAMSYISRRPDRVRRFTYSVGRANEILDNLGWVDTNGDGIREDKEGNTIEFALTTNGDNTVRGAVTEHIAEGLLAIGVKANYDVGRIRRACRPIYCFLRLGGHRHRLDRRHGPLQRHRHLA